MGASGSGKSSLLRAIAGLWTSGQGEIRRPELEDILFLPQRPYMILGTLREQLLYPRFNQGLGADFLQSVLEQVNLPDLAERFGGWEAEENWENVLSLGEQQRVALARVFVNQLPYAILDEATSALDVDNEALVYGRLAALGTTYISVGHRPTLMRYHRQRLEIRGDGAWELTPLDGAGGENAPKS
jgi:putative ATP-binding cassette transporter